MSRRARARRVPGWLARGSLAGLAALFCGCADAKVSAPELPGPGDVRAYVTAEVASQLAPGGTFALAAPPDSLRVNLEKATELALSFARTFGPSMRVTLERQHGAPIDFERLRVGPAYYAETPYGPLPGEVHPAYHNLYGPYYLVYLLRPDGTPAVVVAVAGHAQAWIENGRIRLPLNYGNEFHPSGVRLGEGFAMPLSPEQAVRRVSEATGALAASVPQLLSPDEHHQPVYSRWKVTLDRPVAAQVRDSRQVRRVREVYVGIRGEISVPSDEQPGEAIRPNTPAGGTIRVPVVRGRPVAFEAVTVSAQ